VPDDGLGGGAVSRGLIAASSHDEQTWNPRTIKNRETTAPWLAAGQNWADLPLTAVAQTGRVLLDSGGLLGHPVDADLRLRIRTHWLDRLHW